MTTYYIALMEHASTIVVALWCVYRFARRIELLAQLSPKDEAMHFLIGIVVVSALLVPVSLMIWGFILMLVHWVMGF